MTNSWFAVDKDGLSKLLEDRGKAFVLNELVQNAWDTQAKNVSIRLEKLPGRPFAELTVIDDDPNGFHDLSHAYTLFAESVKKGDPEKRGRYNLGEKLVLALCKHARVESTTGTILFNEDGTMSKSRKKTERGSVFQAVIRMTTAEYEEVCVEMFRLIPPEGVTTLFNGEEILPFAECAKVAEFEATLPTLAANEEGTLIKTKRKTRVEAFETSGGQPGWIYEMGIPVVETGDKYHVNVHQKVPLNMDRDNVTPGYLRRVRAETLNATAKLLTEKDAQETWVTNAMEDEAVEDDAVVAAVEKRFGEKRVVYDPNDVEASQNAMAKGYTVMHGGSLPKRAWEAVKRSQAAFPAGQIMPTPHLYSDDPDAIPREEIHPDNWTQGMKEVEEITRWLCAKLGINDDLLVMFIVPRGPKARRFAATWGSGGFEWNVTCLGRRWFENWVEHFDSMLDTIIHEFSHEDANTHSHLNDEFHKACTRNGGRGMKLMLLHGKQMPHAKKVLKHYLG